MNLQELRRLVNSEYRKAINEGRARMEAPPEARGEYDRIKSSRMTPGMAKIKSKLLKSLAVWNVALSEPQEFETLVASELLEFLRSSDPSYIDFDDASDIIEGLLDDEDIAALIDEYDWGTEPEITIDGVMEELTKLMDDSDY